MALRANLAAQGLLFKRSNPATVAYPDSWEAPMSRLTPSIIAAAVWLCALTQAQAGIVVTVDKSAQRLTVAVDGIKRFDWPVSTARMGYRTPNGSYRPERLERKWFSRKYDWSPMPYSIFFNEGYAIHGSYEISHLGRPASHGCIRLHPDNAAVLYNLVKERMSETQIVVTGEGPAQDVRTRGEEYAPVVRTRGETKRASGEGKRAPGSFEEIFGNPPGDVRRNWRR
jgi:lipoprotein-anchoring transpeptidase ErfK/SrfK